MGWLGFGSEIAKPAKVIADGLDELFTSDDERAQAKYVLEKLRQQPLIMQAIINKENAIKGSFFHNGWRSMAGWVCVGGLAYASIIGPIMEQVFFWQAPKIEIGLLLDLLIGLLGLAGIRTIDKMKGTARQ